MVQLSGVCKVMQLNSLLEYVMNTRKMFSKIVVFLFPASYIYGKSIEGCKILWELQNPEPATKCSGVCKVMSDCSQAAECLAGFTLPSCCEVPWICYEHTKSVQHKKSRILVSGLENEGTFQAASNFYVGCEIQRGLQNPSRASKSFEGCKILWSVQNPESAAKSFTEASKS